MLLLLAAGPERIWSESVKCAPHPARSGGDKGQVALLEHEDTGHPLKAEHFFTCHSSRESVACDSREGMTKKVWLTVKLRWIPRTHIPGVEFVQSTRRKRPLFER